MGRLATPRPFPLLLALLLLWAAAGCTPFAEAESVITTATTTPAVSTATPSATPVAATSTPLPTAVPSNTPRSTATASATPLPLPRLDNPRDPALAAEAAEMDAAFVRLHAANTGVWQYASHRFIHPIALEVIANTAYLLDAGRVLVLDLAQPSPPRVLLFPGAVVAGVRVLEPLDLALAPDGLLVLDRAGDVYRYDFAAARWAVERYDRPAGDSSGHYYVAVDAPDVWRQSTTAVPRALLETNYKFTRLYGGERERLWNIAEDRAVDVSMQGEGVYVLQQALQGTQGSLALYQDTRYVGEFAPRVDLEAPRQVVATQTAVYVLDREGARLLALDPQSGALLRIYQLPRDAPPSVFWADAGGSRLLLAGRDRLYFVDEPARRAAVSGGPALRGPQPHDPHVLESVAQQLSVPIGGSNLSSRDFQMPGAPRHYRLGTHQGVDFYWRPGTPVLAAGDGVVIRAELEYEAPTDAQLDAWWWDAQARGYTSDEVLDHYRGRQVWIQHADGLVTRYAHLRSIAPGIAEGVRVQAGQPLGEVGNSGSPASRDSATADAHLHFEIWLDDAYVGQFMRPIESRTWIAHILDTR